METITSEQAESFKNRIYTTKSLSIASKAIGWVLGILLVIAVIALSIKTHRIRMDEKYKDYKPLTLATQSKYGTALPFEKAEEPEEVVEVKEKRKVKHKTVKIESPKVSPNKESPTEEIPIKGSIRKESTKKKSKKAKQVVPIDLEKEFLGQLQVDETSQVSKLESEKPLLNLAFEETIPIETAIAETAPQQSVEITQVKEVVLSEVQETSASVIPVEEDKLVSLEESADSLQTGEIAQEQITSTELQAEEK